MQNVIERSEDGKKYKMKDNTDDSKLVVCSKVGIGRPAFATCPVKTLIISYDEELPGMEKLKNIDTFEAAKELAEPINVIENGSYSIIEYSTNSPFLWI